MLQSSVEEALRSAAAQVDEMLQRQDDLRSVLYVLDAGMKYGDENDACLTAEARAYKTRLHTIRSICMYRLIS